MNEDTNITDDLSAAWDSVEESSNEAIETSQNTGIVETDTGSDRAGLQANDDNAVRGTEEKGGPVRAKRGKDNKPDTASDTAGGQEATDNIVDAGQESLREPEQNLETPPVSLPPDAREVWKDTPLAMKAAIAKREADYAKGVEKYRENANRAVKMDSVLGQYQHYFATTGQNPGQVVNTLLRTASNLRSGNAMINAQTVAGIIKDFGTDINLLDDILSGQNVPRGTQPNDVDQRIQQGIQQALTPYMQQIERQKAYERHQQQQVIGSELQQFAKNNEFYNDVCLEMADFLDVASKQGKQMPLKEAYDRACWANPTIRQIMTTRANVPTQQQQRAASTLRGGGLGGEGGSPEPQTLRAAIEAAFDSVGRV